MSPGTPSNTDAPGSAAASMPIGTCVGVFGPGVAVAAAGPPLARLGGPRERPPPAAAATSSTSPEATRARAVLRTAVLATQYAVQSHLLHGEISRHRSLDRATVKSRSSRAGRISLSGIPNVDRSITPSPMRGVNSLAIWPLSLTVIDGSEFTTSLF